MDRRIHSSKTLNAGTLELDQSQAHHIRDVLRLGAGDVLEAFDDAGNVAEAVIEQCDANHVMVRMEQVREAGNATRIVIASAVPKGDRADWMIEKLSEVGVQRFIPLQTARSVVHPTGSSKFERWKRIASESAKQSRRAGVMQIDELTMLSDLVARVAGEDRALYLSTDSAALPILETCHLALRHTPHTPRLLLIGPEGGWSDEEIGLFESRGLTGVKLTATILRVETAAVVAAAFAAMAVASSGTSPSAKPGAMGSDSSKT